MADFGRSYCFGRRAGSDLGSCFGSEARPPVELLPEELPLEEPLLEEPLLEGFSSFGSSGGLPREPPQLVPSLSHSGQPTLRNFGWAAPLQIFMRPPAASSRLPLRS